MNNLQVLLLSIVQGITEVLPISSSGHLIITSKLLNFEISGDLLLLSILHIGTTLAIILFYRKALFQNFFSEKKWLLFLKLIVASIPAALAGFLLDEYIASTLHSTTVIAISLIIVGILFILFENINLKSKKQDPKNISLWKMILIGVGQILALMPGTSRSGITTVTGMILGLEKYSAFEFSFLLGIPILLGSAIYQIGKAVFFSEIAVSSLFTPQALLSVIVTFLIGYVSLLIVKRFKKSKWLTVFGVYRIVIGILILFSI